MVPRTAPMLGLLGLLAACVPEISGQGEPPELQAAPEARTGILAEARLVPAGPVLDDYVEWGVFPERPPIEPGGEPDFSVGEPYDTPVLDLDLEPGRYRVRAEIGAVREAVDVDIVEGEVTEVSLPLETAVIVVDPKGDRPGVSGQLDQPNGRTKMFGTSLERVVLAVEPGAHEIRFQRGPVTVSRALDIAPGTLEVLEPELSVGTLAGAFDFAGGEADFGLEWTIRRWDPEAEKVGERITTRSGRDFEINLPPGDYWVRGRAGGLLRGEATARVTADERSAFTLAVPYTRIVPRLMDTDGEEITEGFYWWLLDADNLDEKPWEVLGPGNDFLTAIPEDMQYVMAARDNAAGEFIAMSQPLDLEAGVPETVTLRAD